MGIKGISQWTCLRFIRKRINPRCPLFYANWLFHCHGHLSLSSSALISSVSQPAGRLLSSVLIWGCCHSAILFGRIQSSITRKVSKRVSNDGILVQRGASHFHRRVEEDKTHQNRSYIIKHATWPQILIEPKIVEIEKVLNGLSRVWSTE